MKISKISIFSAVLLLFSALLSCFAVAEDSATENYIKSITDEVNISGNDFLENAGSTQCDWIAFGTALNGDESTDYLNAIVENLPSKDCSNVTDLYRSGFLIYAMGGDPASVNGRNIFEEGIFYRKSIDTQGANGYIWALLLLDAKNTFVPENAINTRESIITSLLEYANENGGFSLNKKQSDVDITAMALTALAKYRSDERVNTAIEKALEWLSLQQKPSGDFASWGTENSESTAQVIIALTALGIDVTGDERFIKNRNSCLDGLMKYYCGNGFAHIIGKNGEKGLNGIATGQGLCALTAIKTNRNIFDFSDKELNNSISTPDSKPNEKKPSDINKKAIIGILAILTIIIATVIYIKKRRVADVILIFVVFAVIICFLAFSKIQSVEDYYTENLENIQEDSLTVTLTIRCDDAIKSDSFKFELIEKGYIPKDGIILEETQYVLRNGDSVFDILQRAVKHNRIQLEYEGTDSNAFGSIYIEGISYLYEFDCGRTSGWMFKVNGENPNYGISQYYPKDGDKIEIYYTIDYNL